MSRRAVLQIGTEKTGTTSLQHFLAANRERLAARGYLYPRFCGQINHTALAAYAMRRDRTDAIRSALGVHTPEDVDAFRARMRWAAASELSDGATALFCSEHCHSRLTERAEVESLRDFLAEHFDEVRVSVYLRRQDQIALSLHSTKLKSGGTDAHLLPHAEGSDAYYNYDRFLTLWEEAFGIGQVHVRLFDRAELAGGGVVTDFLAAWGLGPVGDFVLPPDQNGSITAPAQAFLRWINPHLTAGAAEDAVRGPIVARLERYFEGRGARPSRAAAEAFYTRFEASNEAVRQRHFPDRAALFDADFAAYPAVEDDRAPVLDDLGAVAGRLLVAAQDEVCRLEAEVAHRDARLLWRDEKRAEAIAALRRALGWRPASAEIQRTLGEYLLRDSDIDGAAAAAWAAARLRPDCAEYQHFLGIVLGRAGALDEALAAQEQALVLQPEFEGAARERDRLLARATPPDARSA